MELHATGNNAWNQLVFEGAADASKEPTDFTGFRLVLEDAVIERPYASLACTLGRPPASRIAKPASLSIDKLQISQHIQWYSDSWRRRGLDAVRKFER